MMEEVKTGADTSEFAVTQSAGLMGTIATIIGIIIAVASAVASMTGETSVAGVIAGAVVAIGGQIQRTLTALAYTKSRTEVKLAAGSGSAASPTGESSASASPAGSLENVSPPELGE